ncbi:MAG: FkbM family methyltransferase [Phycisphaerae bacterium]
MGLRHKIKQFWRFRQYFSSPASWLRFSLMHIQGSLVPGGAAGEPGGDKRLVRLRVRGAGKPVVLRRHTTDYLVCREIFVDGEYDILLRYVRGEVRAIFDLGANIGLFTRFALQNFPDARIAAVEPDPGNMQTCRENIHLSGRQSAVTLIEGCVAGSTRLVDLSHAGGEWAYKMVEASTDRPNHIAAMTIPQIAQAAGLAGEIDILKCDVEGAEQEIFANCAEWINRVRYLLVELHKPYSAEAFLADIRRSGAPLHVLESGPPDEPNVVLLLARAQT